MFSEGGWGGRKRNAPVLTCLVSLELVPNHTYHDVVRDEPTGIHDFFCLNAEWGLFGDLIAEHVARREVTDAAFVTYVRCLCALAWNVKEQTLERRGKKKKRGAWTYLTCVVRSNPP